MKKLLGTISLSGTTTVRVSMLAGAMLAMGGTAMAVDPGPLESAYWRFEEGADGVTVDTDDDSVVDSINQNHLKTETGSAPAWTSAVAPAPLRSELPNLLAMKFTADAPNSGQYLYTKEKNINNGILSEGGGFTLEGAFTAEAVGGFTQTILSKAGFPDALSSAPTLALNIRGDTGELHFEQFDGSGALRGVRSLAPLMAGHWYNFAIVNEGDALHLFLDANDGAGYVLQATDLLSGGGLYQGTQSSWDWQWYLGQQQFGDGGGYGNWFGGTLDEMRLSNVALAPSNFLFQPIPEPSSLLLLAVTSLAILLRRRQR